MVRSDSTTHECSGRQVRRVARVRTRRIRHAFREVACDPEEADVGGAVHGGFEDLGAGAGVCFHDIELPVAPSARLEEHRVGEAGLADVVQGAGEIDEADELGGDVVLELGHAGHARSDSGRSASGTESDTRSLLVCPPT